MVGSGMRVGRPAGGSSWPPRTHHPGAARPARRWWSATSATTSASPCPSPTRCCWPSPIPTPPPPWRPSTPSGSGAPSAGWSQCAGGMRGHRGDGQSLATVAGVPRLVDGAPGGPAGGRPDGGGPALHVHVTPANMTQGRRRPLVDGGPRPAASPRTTPTASASGRPADSAGARTTTRRAGAARAYRGSRPGTVRSSPPAPAGSPGGRTGR